MRFFQKLLQNKKDSKNIANENDVD